MKRSRRHEPTAEEMEILRKLNAAVDCQRRTTALRSAIEESPQIQANIRALASVSGQGYAAVEGAGRGGGEAVRVPDPIVRFFYRLTVKRWGGRAFYAMNGSARLIVALGPWSIYWRKF